MIEQLHPPFLQVSLNMESETFAPQEAIIRLNEPPEKMFVVRKGVVAGNGRIHTSGSVIGTDMLFEARTTRRAHRWEYAPRGM